MSGLGPTSKRSLFPTAEVRVATSIRIRSGATIQQGGGVANTIITFLIMENHSNLTGNKIIQMGMGILLNYRVNILNFQGLHR